MMARSPKTVTFTIPVELASPKKETISPAPTSKPPTMSPLALQSQGSKNSQVPTVSPSPDLAAGIVNRTTVVNLNKLQALPSQSESTSVSSPKTRPSPKTQLHCGPGSDVSKKTRHSPKKPVNSVPHYLHLAHSKASTSSFDSSPGGDRSPLLTAQKERSRISASVTTAIVRDLRGQSNNETHKHIRSLKLDVSHLREHLLNVEEEIKNLNRGRHTLDITIQDVRKALSVNQQSISTQQKKSSRGEEDSSIKILREESRVLSKTKRSIEQHLQAVKTHLQLLDTSRRNLKSKISSLSSTLEMDAQNFKVYEDPISLKPNSTSRQQRYTSLHRIMNSDIKFGQEAATLCSATADVVKASKTVRNEIKALVMAAHTKKTDAHKKTTDSISKNIQDARAKKSEIILERGQMRIAQNSTLHQMHEQEIALGVALGPVSDSDKSVSEKVERPLSQLRPASAIEERQSFKRTKRDLKRRLSASCVRASQESTTGKQLAARLQEGEQAVTLDSQTLRVRKMSLDNRWVN